MRERFERTSTLVKGIEVIGREREDCMRVDFEKKKVKMVVMNTYFSGTSQLKSMAWSRWH